MTDATFLPFLTTIAARSAIVFVALIVGVRVFGKREMAGMSIFDLVLVLLLANAVQNAMTSGSGHLAVGIAAAGSVIVLGRILGIAFVWRPSLELSLTGSPVIIVQNGQLHLDQMRQEGVTTEEILAAARGYGLERLDQIRLAVLEADGSLSIVPTEEKNSKAT